MGPSYIAITALNNAVRQAGFTEFGTGGSDVTLKDTPEKSPSTTDTLQRNLAQKTDAAANEGRRDVEQAKSVGSSYLGTAKTFAGSALATAQVCVTVSRCRSRLIQC